MNCHVPWVIVVSSWFNTGERLEAHRTHRPPRTLFGCTPSQIEVDQSSVAFRVDHNVRNADIAVKGPYPMYVFEGCKRGKRRGGGGIR